MIEHLRGTILLIDETHIVLDVGGVGYGVDVPRSTLEGLPDPGGEVSLHTQMVVREDDMQLFGFATPEERSVFNIFNSVSGIGPRTALDVLSVVPIPELAVALQTGNVGVLTRVPGIGRKRAERLIVELRDRVNLFPSSEAQAGKAAGDRARPTPDAEPNLYNDAVAALQALGHKPSTAETLVTEVLRAEGTDDMALADLVKHALKLRLNP